ncbi:hypothetical protein JOM56_011059 [Amanita muscaria]
MSTARTGLCLDTATATWPQPGVCSGWEIFSGVLCCLVPIEIQGRPTHPLFFASLLLSSQRPPVLEHVPLLPTIRKLQMLQSQHRRCDSCGSAGKT